MAGESYRISNTPFDATYARALGSTAVAPVRLLEMNIIRPPAECSRHTSAPVHLPQQEALTGREKVNGSLR